MTDPVIPWPGGKRALAPAVRGRGPASFDRYAEPLVGAGAVALAVAADDALLGDVNPRLVALHRAVRDAPEELVAECRRHRPPEAPPDPDRAFADRDRSGDPVEDYYTQQRALFNRRPNGEPVDPVAEAGRFVYLMWTGFNGLYRENGAGEFNVPPGTGLGPEWPPAARIRRASRALRGASLRTADFEWVADELRPGDFCYLDPPYDPAGPGAGFVDYASDGFDAADQRRLLDVAATLADRGVAVVVSNTAGLADEYRGAGFDVDLVTARRTIGADADTRGEVEEMLATSVPPGDRRRPPQATLGEF